MTSKTYYEIFIRPALDIINEEYAERFGKMLVKCICTGGTPADNEMTDDEKLLWNVFMFMVEVKFNPCFSTPFSDDEL